MADVTTAEGPGRRFVVWTQGCSIGCPGCANPQYLRPDGGRLTSVTTLLSSVLDARRLHGLRGITVVGGEPFDQPVGLASLLRGANEIGLDTLVFTGHTLEVLRGDERPGVAEALAATDALVDGPYLAALRTEKLYLRGSSNQRLHVLSPRFTPADLAGCNRFEARASEGQIRWCGFPFAAALGALAPLGAPASPVAPRPGADTPSPPCDEVDG